MQKTTYTIPESRREDIEKLVVRYQRKAAKYNAELVAEFGEPYAVTVPVYKLDEQTHVMVQVGTMMVEAFDLTIDGEEIRKDGYTVVARIQHLEGGNVVNAFNTAVKREWVNAQSRCEHCNSNRYRSVTFIVRHDDGSEKQVGRTCLQDYCGIDPQAIGFRNELREILLKDDVNHYDFDARPVSQAFSVMDALALAIRAIREQGYVKSGEPNSNKGRIAEYYGEGRPTEDELQQAEVIAQGIRSMDIDDAISARLDNVKSMLECGYCKSSHFGYIAYAPIAYQKYLEKMQQMADREASLNAQRKASDYVGEIGERINVDVAEITLVTSWLGEWGFTYLYKITDTAGNVLVWFASKPQDCTNVTHMTATVKAHNERDGVKQTIVTRCKIGKKR